jgi:hypothetical protein
VVAWALVSDIRPETAPTNPAIFLYIGVSHFGRRIGPFAAVEARISYPRQ